MLAVCRRHIRRGPRAQEGCRDKLSVAMCRQSGGWNHIILFNPKSTKNFDLRRNLHANLGNQPVLSATGDDDCYMKCSSGADQPSS